MSNIELNISMTDIELAELDAAVDETDGLEYPTESANVDPITGTVLVVGAVFAGAKLVIRLWNEYRGGTVVDSTTQPITIRRDHALPYGFFLFVASDGSVKVDAKDEPKDSLERLVDAFLKAGLGATVDSTKKIISEFVGGDKIA